MANPSVPSFDFSYWKGYCNAVEEFNKLEKNKLWEGVKSEALIPVKTALTGKALKEQNRIRKFGYGV